jgi:hypothetical protein
VQAEEMTFPSYMKYAQANVHNVRMWNECAHKGMAGWACVATYLAAELVAREGDDGEALLSILLMQLLKLQGGNRNGTSAITSKRRDERRVTSFKLP